MANLELQFHSRVLKLDVTVNVVLPEPAKAAHYRTLYLFHGLGGDGSNWVRKTSIERHAARHGIAVVMPSVGRSWYTDTVGGAKWFTFVTEELPAVCRSYFRGMSDKREDTFVGGISMGGYGAVKAALHCPETFGGCISLSGSLDVTRKGREMTEEFLREWQSIFGVLPAELEGSGHDLFAVAKRNREQGIPLPKLYLWCGTEDHLIEVNRKFRDYLESLRIPHCYRESEGDHSWKWWDLQIREALDWILEEKSVDSTENKA